MSEPTDLGDLFAASAESFRDRPFAEAEVLAPGQRHVFAVSVLPKATMSVLEAVRKEAPAQHRTYLDVAVPMLNDS